MNFAIIINAEHDFSFQVKNIPVYFSVRKNSNVPLIEGIPLLYEPLYYVFSTYIGNLAVIICKDFLVNHEVLPIWMNNIDVPFIVIPSLTNRAKPFLNKIEQIVDLNINREKTFVFSNVAEFGGSKLVVLKIKFR